VALKPPPVAVPKPEQHTLIVNLALPATQPAPSNGSTAAGSPGPVPAQLPANASTPVANETAGASPGASDATTPDGGGGGSPTGPYNSPNATYTPGDDGGDGSTGDAPDEQSPADNEDTGFYSDDAGASDAADQQVPWTQLDSRRDSREPQWITRGSFPLATPQREHPGDSQAAAPPQAAMAGSTDAAAGPREPEHSQLVLVGGRSAARPESPPPNAVSPPLTIRQQGAQASPGAAAADSPQSVDPLAAVRAGILQAATALEPTRAAAMRTNSQEDAAAVLQPAAEALATPATPATQATQASGDAPQVKQQPQQQQPPPQQQAPGARAPAS
jgi:hypothetical protein